ncbi:serine hydrolase domain-containing protein [Stenotrophomonas sp. NLF4-10]|uniref:serine hydrolase domain-containing protein n=1 Tax=Stenotrophomonas sp. NLF4-10 TaxID=2918754 RepID=UPI001EFB8804|nr:serine hydrolase domain-containing protein [Stenotrophomonas sp. NLF4-10]MCG8274809.1 beta-lactamase family protein [Stenotrophomonas sp. NLF4-10]
MPTKRLLLCLLLLPAAAHAAVDDDGAARYQQALDAAYAHYRLPGIAVGVIEDGKVAYTGARGELAAGEGVPVDADTLFKIASNTKAMTAAVLARLVQAGKLRWDDPVTRHLPQFRMHDPWVTAHMQVRDLLIHNSGLGLGAGDLMLWPEPNHFSREDIIAGLAHLKPAGSFRADYAYDNLLYVVAGEVAAAAGGKPYAQLLREEIFEPLGMARCQAGPWSPAAVGNVARPHRREAARNIPAAADPARVDDFPSMAAGGVRCSLNDMLRWMQVLLDPQQAPGWLDATQRRALWTAHMSMPVGQRQRDWDNTHFHAYGYGWRLSDMDGQWKVAHTGTLSGMYSSLALLPDRRSGAVILINGEAEDARTALMQALLKQQTRPGAGLDVAYYAGLLEREAAQRRAGGHGPVPLPQGVPATVAGFGADAGVWADPWFGRVALCPAGDDIAFASEKSPAMHGRVMLADGRPWVRWQGIGEDADAWLEFTGDGPRRRLHLRAIDPDIDFSYDFQDLEFSRVGDCR